MAISYERRLLSKAIESGNIEKLITLGVRENHFADEVCKSVWSYIVAHMVKYKIPPSVETICSDNNKFAVDSVSDSLDYLVDAFFAGTKRRMTIDCLENVAKAVDDPKMGDPAELMLEAAKDLANTVPSGSVGRLTDMEERIAKYEYDKKHGVKRGITTGVPSLDAITEGIQPHEMVVVSGYSGTGKSTFLQHMLYKAKVVDDVTPMMISLEMSKEALFRKWDIMFTHHEYLKMKKFNLTDDEMSEWRDAAKSVKDDKSDIIVLDSLGKCTIEKIYSEINKYRPDIVGIDYVSLLHTPKHAGSQMWEKLTYITNNLKYIAQSLNVPIIAVAQTNSSEAASLDNIAHSKSIVRDADLVLGLYQDEIMREDKLMQLRVNKNRDGPIKNIDMHWDMSTMHFEEASLKHMFISNKDD